MSCRIAYIGNFRPGFKHPTCTETYLARAFRENGCDVAEWQQETAFGHGPSLFGDFQLRAEAGSGGRAPRPDLVLYTRTHNTTALGAAWSDCWARLEAAGIRTASFHLDRFWDLEREHLIHDADPLFTTGTVFTADGGNDDRWKAAGINHRWLPPAVDRQEATYVGQPTLGNDVPPIVFTGSDYSQTNHRGYYKERGALLYHLNRTYGRRFGHYGHGGNRPVVRGLPLNDVYATAQIIVGDSCFANAAGTVQANGRYWSDRIPETVGRGGFLLHPWVPGLRDSYLGSELATYNPGDWDDLDAQIGMYLANPGEREGMVERGRARVLREHTYTHRTAEMLDVLGIVRPEPAAVDGP